MSRPDRRAQRNPSPQHNAGQEQEQEQEVQTETEGQETEQQRAQNQLGNAAMADMLASRNTPDGGDQEGGGGLAMGLRSDEKEGQEFGGDDDPLEDSPVTIEELTASWNPTSKKKEDRPAFLESMPDDDLPPEDDEWLAHVRGLPAPALPDLSCPDGLLQPSLMALAGSLGPWSREAARWLDPTLAHRCLGYTITRPPSCLQDPLGRVLHARIRLSALISWTLLDTKLLRSSVSLGTASFLDFTLETASGARRMHETTRSVLEMGQKLPRAADLLAEFLPDDGRTVTPRPLPPTATTRIIAVLSDLTQLESPRTLIPSLLIDGPPPDDDDPLGLDAVLAEYTGGAIDHEAAVYHAAVQGAERLAGACARTRVAFVGATLAVADACSEWLAGAPAGTLNRLAAHIDQRVQSALQLLVEIARAAQRRSVPPRGLMNGLKRAARQLQQIREEAFRALSQVVGAVIPGEPSVPGLPAEHPDDPLTVAWRDGTPSEALPWLEALPRSPARSVAMALTRCGSGESPISMIDPLLQAADEVTTAGRPFLGRALETLVGPCFLWANQPDRALALAETHMAVARSRRNAAVLASSSLLAMEAHMMADRRDEALAVREAAGRWCFHLGGYGSLSVLARWTPSEE